MLSPNEIADYRHLFSADVPADDADSYHFSSVAVVPTAGRRGPEKSHRHSTQGSMYPADQIFGVPADPSCLAGIDSYPVATPIPRLLRCARARIIGNMGVLDARGGLFTPDPFTDPSAATDLLELNERNHDGFILSRHRTGLRATFVSRPQPRRFAKTALFLHNLEPGNYGSFLFRQLPQLLALADAPPKFDCYVVPDRTLFLKEAIALTGLPSKPIYTVAEVCGEEFAEVLFVNNLDAAGFLGPQTVESLRRFVLRVAGRRSQPAAQRLYASRALGALRQPDYRCLTNEIELEALAIARGYEVIYPETLSLAEQIRAFSGARLIAGPSGSGMLNALFAPAGARVLDLESYSVTVGQHAMLYASCGHRYAFLFGTMDASDERPLWLRSWQVQPHEFEEALHWLDEARGEEARG